MATVATSKITSKGQITIPRKVRLALGVSEGDRIEWEADADGHVAVRRLGGRLEDLVGLLGKPMRSASVADMDRGIRRHMAKKHARS